MKATKSAAYSAALVVSIAYAIWYIGAGALLNMDRSVSSLFLLFVIEGISALFVFISARGRVGVGKVSYLKYPILSGLCFLVANYLLFSVIVYSGVPAASSFASAEIVIFTALLWFEESKGRRKLVDYALGAFLVSIGLVAESLAVQHGAYSLNFNTIGLGVGVALFAGLATYFYYLSVKTLESKQVTIFYIQGIQSVLFLLLLTITGGAYPPLSIGIVYWVLLVIVGAGLFVAFYSETVMMKLLVRFSRGVVATGYVLSDLELLPVLVYFLIVNPAEWLSFAPGLVIITVGMVMLEW
ncbi:hypothetical protein M1397_00265 [Candidatus Marsarchaeota archaeon]|jgi:drug/metabolite transporter (DMT)-like permease|nr:hypothetical protein [Candidatus Marsarchaeota archaeon]